jgi:SAM-dependent methyltransferase
MDLAGLPKKSFFDAVYAGPAPWDIGAPQPELMRLIEELPPRGRVLDLGCGTGDLAIGLAKRGIAVLGVDFVEAALDVARSRSLDLPSETRALVEFQAGDALHPSRWSGRIGCVTDSGFYHLFDSATRHQLVEDLASALPRGGRYYMLGFAVSFPVPDAPREVTRAELEALFVAERGWSLRVLRSARFVTNGFDDVPAVLMCAERV